ncbi:MAG: alpha/beta fold hydrolase [Candidatus Bathycorpusculaceae bacterium]
MDLTLLFIHGAGGNHTIWEHQTRHFNNAIAIDLPGHRLGEGRRTIEEYVEEVKRFCEERELKNIVMIGHSMGGAIAQKFSLNHTEHLRALVLVGTGARLRVAPIIFQTIKKDYGQLMELMKKFAFSDKTAMEVKNKVAEEMRKIKPEVLYGDFEACDKFDVMEKLDGIKVPTLIICGKDDQLTPVKYSEYLKVNIPDSRLEVLADAGHMVMLEKPKEFNEILEKFIKELDNG